MHIHASARQVPSAWKVLLSSSVKMMPKNVPKRFPLMGSDRWRQMGSQPQLGQLERQNCLCVGRVETSALPVRPRVTAPGLLGR